MVTTKLMTAQDLFTLGDSGDNCELIRGVLIELPPPSFGHGRIMANLARLLGSFVKEHRLGRLVAGDAGFVLQHDPDTVLGPDLAFVTVDHMPDDETTYSNVPPDLAVEIVSPSNSAAEIDRQIAIYLGAGVRTVWTVYPKRRQVIVHEPDHTSRTFDYAETLTGGEVLPGLSLTVSEIFDD